MFLICLTEMKILGQLTGRTPRKSDRFAVMQPLKLMPYHNMTYYR